MTLKKLSLLLILFLFFPASDDRVRAEQDQDAVFAVADSTLISVDQQNRTEAGDSTQQGEQGNTPIAAVSREPLPEAESLGVEHPSVSIITAEDMQKNWEEIFVEGTSPDLSEYTIQSGDSLYVIAKKNGTTGDLIKRINGLKKDTIYAGRKLKLYKGTFAVLVDKSDNTLTLSASGKPVKQYKVSTGKDNSTPTGTFRVNVKLKDPTWFKTGAIYAPGSPKNQLGTRWLGFDKPGYGIHGTTEPEKIGQQASEGCIRMTNADVEELYGIVPAGVQVIVQD
jgi:lipoprotein-anchoring transpeptidase ErfK/SrfK